jgi:hypothetical protein
MAVLTLDRSPIPGALANDPNAEPEAPLRPDIVLSKFNLPRLAVAVCNPEPAWFAASDNEELTFVTNCAKGFIDKDN